MKKRIIAMVLSVAMMLTMFPTGVLAEDFIENTPSVTVSPEAQSNENQGEERDIAQGNVDENEETQPETVQPENEQTEPEQTENDQTEPTKNETDQAAPDQTETNQTEQTEPGSTVPDQAGTTPDDKQPEPEQPATDPAENGVSDGAESKTEFTVTWKNGETVLAKAKFAEGTSAEEVENAQPAETPVQEADVEFVYIFSGWDHPYEAVTADQTYEAKFTKAKKFTVTWVSEGETILTKTFAEGTSAEEVENAQPAEAPVKEAGGDVEYTFAGWTPDYADVTADQTYTAKFEEPEQDEQDEQDEMVSTASLFGLAANIYPVARGKTCDLYGSYSNTRHEWKSSNENVATVSGSGRTGTVTGISEGFARITHKYTYYELFQGIISETETFTVKVVESDAASNEEWAQVYYLKDPDKFVTLNDASNFGDLYDVVKVDTTNMSWDSGGKNYSGDDIETRVIDWRPYGYAVVPEGEHWDAIFNNFKASKEKELGVTIEKGDVTQIRIVPAKISHNNKGTIPDYHVDCNVEIYCKDVATVRYFLKDAGTANFNPLGAKSYVINGESTTHPTDLDGVTTTSFPTFKTVGEVQYKFVGWEKKTGSEVTHVDFGETRQPVTGNADYYAEYTAPHTVTYQPNGGNWSGSTNPVVYNSLYKGDTHTVQQTEPTRDGYTFTGWKLEGTDTIYMLNGTIKMPDSDVVLVAQWKQSQFEVEYQYDGEVPEKAPALPRSQKATCNDQVTVEATPPLDGYTFSGWTSSDVTIENGKFTMPAKDVILTGTWAKRTDLSYTVKYQWNGQPIEGKTPKTVGEQTYGSEVTEQPIPIEGYLIKPNQSGKLTITANSEKNVIIFNYYKNVTLKADSGEKTYNGDTQTIEGYKAMVGETELESVKFDVTASGTGKDVKDGGYPVIFNKTAEQIPAVGEYKVTELTPGTLTIKPKAVTIKVEDASKTYGEQDPTFTGTVEGLVNANDLGAVTYARTNTDEAKGNYPGVLEAHYTENGNYAVTVTKGDFTINGKSVEHGDGMDVNEPSNYPYDGAAHKWAPTVTDGEKTLALDTDYTVAYTYDKPTNPEVTDFTNVTGEITVTITGKGNYSGTVIRKYQITPRGVLLTSIGGSKTYDGTPLEKPNVIVGGDGFVDGEVDNLRATGSVTNVSDDKVLNKIKYDTIGNFNADNYLIYLNEGELYITPVTDEVTVTITGNTNTVTYNGKEQSVEGYKVDSINNKLYKEADFKLNGEAKAPGTDANPNDERYMMGLEKSQFSNTSANFTNVTFVVKNDGWLRINPLEGVVVTITGNTDTVPYNGVEQSVEGYTVEFTKNPGDLYNATDFKLNGKAKAAGTDAGTYNMGFVATSFENTNPNFRNVVFNITDGWLKITPKEIVPGENNTDLTATTPKDVVYNGESQQQKPVVKDGDKALKEGKDYTLTYSEDTTNAGTVTVTITGKGNYDSDSKFEVTYKITPATLTITTNSAEKTYDESALTAGGKIEGVVEHDKDEVKLNITGSQTEVGSSQNTYKIVWGNAKKSNYEITEDIGTLKVNARSGGGSSKPTPEEEPTPTPTPTPLPTLPTTPAPTTPARRVTRSTATVTEPASRPTEQITENETPKAESEPEVIEDEETPLAPMATGAWALVNLILMLLTVLASLLLLLGYLGKKKYAKEDEYGNALHDANGNEIIDYTRNKKGFWRVASLIPAIAAVIAFALTENMRLPMVMTDRWTLLMVIIAVVQLIVAVLCKKKKESEEDENQANA